MDSTIAPLPMPTLRQNAGEQAVQGLSAMFKKIVTTNTGNHPCLEVPCPPPRGDWTGDKNKAEAAIKIGQYNEAETAWLKALVLAEQFSYKDPRVVYTLNGLGLLHFATGNLEKSEEYYNRALTLAEFVYGKIHISVVACLNNLAGVYYCAKRYADAEAVLVRMLIIYNKINGPDHHHVGSVADRLAMLYHEQGRLDLAKLMYERALPINRDYWGTEHPLHKRLVKNYTNLLCKAVDVLD